MKVAIVSTEPSLDAEIETDFGHSYYLLIIDLDTMGIEPFFSSDIEVVRGIGIRTAQLMINKGADTLISHYCGSFCYETLKLTGIKIITGARGSVREAIRRFVAGELQYATGPNINIPSHLGSKDRMDFFKNENGS